MVHCEIARDRCEALAEFCSVAPVTPIAKTAEPVGAMSLRNHRTRPDDFPALAPRIASSTDLVQATLRGWQVFCLWQSSLASRLTCAINVKDDPPVSHSIYQSTCLLLIGGVGSVRSSREWTTEQVIEKEPAQGFDWRFGQRR